MSFSVIASELVTLDDVVSMALADEPGILAIDDRLDSYLLLATAASELPDPRIQFGAANLPLDSGGISPDRLTHLLVGVKQDMPSKALRREQRTLFNAKANELKYARLIRQLVITKAVYELWIDLHREANSALLVTENRNSLHDLLDATRSMYAVGLQNQTNVLKISLEISQLDDKLRAIEQRKQVANAQLSKWVRDLSLEQLQLTLPKLVETDPLSELEHRLIHHPITRQASSRIAIREANVGVARSAFQPNWSGEVSYLLRDEGDSNTELASHFATVLIGVEIPLFASRRQEPRLKAALQEESASNHQRTVILRDLRSRLYATYERSRFLDERIDQYETHIVGEAMEYAEVAVSSYQSEVGDFEEVIQSARLALDVQLELLELIVSRHRTQVELDFLTVVADEQ